MEHIWLLDEQNYFAGDDSKEHANANGLKYTDIPIPQPWNGIKPKLINEEWVEG